MSAAQEAMDSVRFATLEPIRFGEFLRERNLISEEQWLAALAEHWSSPHRTRIGSTIVASGFLPLEIVEAEARAFHDELDVVEVVLGVDQVDRSDRDARDLKTTVPMPTY
jgi:hypothetical protein